MHFAPSEEQQLLRQEIIDFARTHLNSGAAERDAAQLFPHDLWRRCGELRLQGLFVPDDFGGRALDAVSGAAALEALGYACPDGGLSFSICAHLLACVVPIWKHGSDEQKRRYLHALSDGSLIAANAMSEPASGSDAFAMATRAERTPDGFLLNGTKTFCTNAPVADVFVMYAATDAAKGFHGGITAFVIPRDTRGVSVGAPFNKLGLRTSHMSEVYFDNASVSSDAVLGRPGQGASIFAQSMDWERACLGAIHVGTMHRLLDLTVKHTRRRRRHGTSADNVQGVSHQIADVKVRLEAARLLVYRAASRLDRSRDAAMDAAIAKLFVSESLVAAADTAFRILGSSGLAEGAEAERALRDALASTVYSGTSEIQRNIISRWLGLQA